MPVGWGDGWARCTGLIGPDSRRNSPYPEWVAQPLFPSFRQRMPQGFAARLARVTDSAWPLLWDRLRPEVNLPGTPTRLRIFPPTCL